MAARTRPAFGPALLAAGLLLGPRLAAQPPAARTPPIWIYFPPIPPALGADRPPAAAQPAWPAPPELASFVAEPFYGPLGAALKAGGDDPVRDAELGAYRADREALLAELRAQLDTLKDADAQARRQGLAAFSAEVQPRVLALQRRAEQLRAELAGAGGGRNQFIRWSIDFADLTAEQARDRTLQSWRMEVDSYFLPGLSGRQRDLLREIAVGLRTPLDPKNEGLFFSPATSRIPLPAQRSAALQSDLDAYHRLKGQLEAALLDAAYPRDPSSVSSRTAALAALAAAQERGFGALEDLAERVRASLADVNDPGRAPDPPMPPQLAAQIAAYRKDKLALQRDLLARVDAVRRRAGASGRPAAPAEIRQAIAAFTQENAARYAALNKSRDFIRAETAKLAGDQPGGAEAEALQARFAASLRQLETFWDYHDYQIAVLQPGLSPGLRRILFEGALEKLSLPLPGAVMQPP
ncbi:MAG TPA: hypothetical protein VHC86_14575 [Opitutaceae bacterium]|nr:hypothetical protein [Opitutaceae bacterium]